MPRQRGNDRSLRVVMVVDHAPLAEVLRLHLEESEKIHAVTAVGSTGNVLRAIDTADAAVVVVDDQTDIDAVELCRIVSSQRPDVHCIILGTAIEPGDEQTALDSGASAYVVKSLSGDTVRDTVHNVFDNGASQVSICEQKNSAC